MRPKLDIHGMRRAKLWEHAVRFVFGGVITVATGLTAHRWGPAVGGLFLAFPAILPASLTLVEEHDGRRQAVEDARGACVGAIPLALFATTVWLTSSRTPPLLALAFATLVWGLAGLAAWTLVFGRRRA